MLYAGLLQKNQKHILSCAFRTGLFAERQNLRDTMKPIQHDSAADRIPRTRNRMRWIQSKLAMGAFIRSATWDSWRPKVTCILPLPSSAGMEIEYCSKIQALSHQKACQSTTAMRWRSGIGAEVLLDNQRHQRNDLKEIACESVRIHTQNISTYPNQWQRLQHLDAVATSLKQLRRLSLLSWFQHHKSTWELQQFQPASLPRDKQLRSPYFYDSESGWIFPSQLKPISTNQLT